MNDKDFEKIYNESDKLENVKFYSQKCGFNIESTENGENVKVVRNYPLTHFILT